MTTSLSTHSRFKPVLRLVFVVALIAAAAGFYVYRCESGFAHIYSVYADRASAHAEAAFLPGSISNPIRQDLNQTLTDVLGKKMSASERAALSEHGLELLKEADAQVDTMGEGVNAVNASINDLEASARWWGNLRHRDERLQIVALARQEESSIEDIRGYSYRSNFHTAEIFTRILTDKGELTRDYVLELNDAIPQLEDQFNKRSNLYTDLEGTKGKITKLYSDIEG